MPLGKKLLLFINLLIIFLFVSAKMPWDEGMFPLSEISRLDLKKAGLKIDQKQIFNPDSVSLIDALVNVGGCTGSFISDEGLIITNHHCAFSAVQQASTPEKDYLTNGFVARNREMEIPSRETCRITEGYEDVSDKILNAVANVSDPALRINIIKDKIKSLVAEAEAADKSIKAEVSEMFIGKTYVLFKYKQLVDVRLVYVPARSIGEFGGETDNWVWPRHTGDFSFFRAYVAPDGMPAKYSKNNIPYKPKRFLKVNPNGVNEEDFVFILGYPGTTYRNRPWQYIKYQQDYLLPYIADLYEFQNQALEEAGKKDKATQIRLTTRIKRNANTLKNFRGKLKGMRALNLIEQKKAEDEELVRFINGDPDLKSNYGSLLKDIDNLYQLTFSDAQRNLWLSQFYTSTSLLNIAGQITGFRTAMNAKPIAERDKFYADNYPKLENNIRQMFEGYDPDADKKIFVKMLRDALQFPKKLRIDAIDKQAFKGFDSQKQIQDFADNLLSYTKLSDKNYVLNSLIKSPAEITSYSDPLINFDLEVKKQMGALKPENDRREGLLNKLMADYIALRALAKRQNFIPDANSTLRLTYGYVRGYSPSDATYMKPFTSIKGILEKGNSGNPDFAYPAVISSLWTAKDFGPFIKKDINDVPVGFLYNLDTTGGNSGSPVLNADGELIGVNFDRVYEATINDFAWNESYSRSIGVDIRYILWVISKVDKADFLLTEMGIKG